MRSARMVIGVLVVALGLPLLAAGGATAAPSGTPVKIMVSGTFSGAGLDYSSVPDAAKAAAKAVNKSGGIDGHPVQIIVCDQKVDPNTAAACARKAVDEKVVAAVGMYSIYAAQYMPILADAGIPSVAPYALGFDDLSNKLSFPIAGGIIGSQAGAGAVIGDETKAKSVDVPYLDLAGGAGAFASTLVKFGTDPRGLPEPTSTPVPAEGGDVTAAVQVAASHDPDALVFALDSATLPRFVQSYEQTGGDAVMATSTNGAPTSTLEALGDSAEGMYLVSIYKPATLTKDPGVAKMLKEINAYKKGLDLVDGAVGAWAGVHLVADALKGAATPDATTLVSALNQDKAWDTGVTPPVNFTKPDAAIASNPLLSASVSRIFNNGVYYAQYKNGKVVPLGSEAHDPLAK